MNTFQKISLALILAFCATPGRADYAVQYFVGYGVYYEYLGEGDPHLTSTTPGTGLLANNGSHRALVQLMWAGPNAYYDEIDPFNVSGGYAGGDDVVLESRIIEAGVDGYDEWLYNPELPPIYFSTNSLQKPVFMRIHQDDTPSVACHWYCDSWPVYPADIDPANAPTNVALATVVQIGEATSGAACNRCYNFTGPLGCWEPDSPATNQPEIRQIEFAPDEAGYAFDIPYSYSLHAVYGADSVLPGGDWNWQTLAEGADYTVANGVVTLLTAGEGVAPLKMIRIGLFHDF